MPPFMLTPKKLLHRGLMASVHVFALSRMRGRPRWGERTPSP